MKRSTKKKRKESTYDVAVIVIGSSAIGAEMRDVGRVIRHAGTLELLEVRKEIVCIERFLLADVDSSNR